MTFKESARAADSPFEGQRSPMAENTFSIDTLLEQMVAHNASDLHITVGSQPALRVRGHLERLEGAHGGG